MTMKKYLTREEEFEILKLVLDKFLWGGLIVLMYGLYKLTSGSPLGESLYIIGAGAVIFLLFIILLVREYEVTKH